MQLHVVFGSKLIESHFMVERPTAFLHVSTSKSRKQPTTCSVLSLTHKSYWNLLDKIQHKEKDTNQS